VLARAGKYAIREGKRIMFAQAATTYPNPAGDQFLVEDAGPFETFPAAEPSHVASRVGEHGAKTVVRYRGAVPQIAVARFQFSSVTSARA